MKAYYEFKGGNNTHWVKIKIITLDWNRPLVMLATIRDDTWHVLNMQHIIPK